MCQINDLSLIRKAQRGDYASFVALMRTYDLAVLQIARRITESNHVAAELYRRAFLRVHKNIASFRFESSFYTWILRCAASLCIEHLGRRQSWQEGASAPPKVHGHHSLQSSTQNDRSGSFHTALKLLTPRERMVIELKYGQGFPLCTVSDILDIREDIARTSFLRATEKLRNALTSELLLEIDEQEEKPA